MRYAELQRAGIVLSAAVYAHDKQRLTATLTAVRIASATRPARQLLGC
jgi:hypothetical protein